MVGSQSCMSQKKKGNKENKVKFKLWIAGHSLIGGRRIEF
jgi:hypothetical protein